jgi:hypothetical protein
MKNKWYNDDFDNFTNYFVTWNFLLNTHKKRKIYIYATILHHLLGDFNQSKKVSEQLLGDFNQSKKVSEQLLGDFNQSKKVGEQLSGDIIHIRINNNKTTILII